MANSIALMEHYVPILDEKYQKESITSILDTDPALIKVEAGSMKIPIMTTSGLRTHDRTDGGQYKKGKSNLSYQTKTPNYDRNTKFGVDTMDDFETKEVAFGMLAGHFINEEVVPEVDAFRLAKYYSLTTAAVNRIADGALADGAAVLAALSAARTYFDDNSVPELNRVLYIKPAHYNAVADLQTIASRAALDSFGTIIKTPASRLYEEVQLLDTEDGGFIGTGGDNINFLALHKGAVIQGLKHVAPKYIPAEVNQTADGDEFAYRVYGIVEAYNNKKVEGIYASVVAND